MELKEPPKELLIRLAERKYYNERIFMSQFACWVMPFIYTILRYKPNGNIVVFFIMLIVSVSLCVFNFYNVKNKNSFLIKKLSVDPENTIVLYTFRNSNSVSSLTGKTSDFKFELKFNTFMFDKGNSGMYMSVSYQGKELIGQYKIDNWAKQDLKQIVKDICHLKGEKFQMPA